MFHSLEAKTLNARSPHVFDQERDFNLLDIREHDGEAGSTWVVGVAQWITPLAARELPHHMGDGGFSC